MAFKFVPALAALLLMAGPAEAIKAGSDDVASIDVELEHVPNCEVGLTKEVCLAGYDDGGTPDQLSDDTAFLYVATKRIVAAANTGPFQPTGLSDVLPNRVAVNAQTTDIENPAFEMAGQLALKINDTRPGVAKPFIEVQSRPGVTLFILRFDPVTEGTPLPKNAGVPILYNWWNVTNTTDIRPLNNDLIQVRGTDDAYQEDILNGSWWEPQCATDPFGVPVEQTGPGSCHAVGTSVTSAHGVLKDNLPDVVCCASTTGVEVILKPEHEDSQGNGDASSAPGRAPDEESLGAATALPSSGDLAVVPLDLTPSVLSLRQASLGEPAGQTERSAEVMAPQPSRDLAAVAALVGGAISALLVGWMLYSRLARDHLLDNQNRKAIYENILATPGITSGEVAERLNLNYRTVERHVSRLLNTGMLVSRLHGRQKRLFENHGAYSARSKTLVILLDGRTAQGIALTLLRNPQETPSSLAQRLGVPVTSLAFHTKRLVEAGAVVKEKRGRERILSLSPNWRLVIAEHLERQGHDVTSPLCPSSSSA